MEIILNIITSVIAILGFALSLVLAIREYRKSRVKFEVRVIDYKQELNVAQLLVDITNLSSQPLTITSICLGGTECELEPKRIKRGPYEGSLHLSPQFPVFVPALGAVFAYLEFVDYSDIELKPETHLTLQIQTTRKSVSKTLLLGNKSHYLHRRS